MSCSGWYPACSRASRTAWKKQCTPSLAPSASKGTRECFRSSASTSCASAKESGSWERAAERDPVRRMLAGGRVPLSAPTPPFCRSLPHVSMGDTLEELFFHDETGNKSTKSCVFYYICEKKIEVMCFAPQQRHFSTKSCVFHYICEKKPLQRRSNLGRLCSFVPIRARLCAGWRLTVPPQ
jgi:hypothetical protein